MSEPEEFVALVRSFPVSVDDEDAPMLAYLIWSHEVNKAGGTPVSGEADLSIREYRLMFDEGESVVRVLGLARRE